MIAQALQSSYITEKDLLSLKAWRENPAEWGGSSESGVGSREVTLAMASKPHHSEKSKQKKK